MRTYIVQFGPNDFGLYASGRRGPFGTPLIARGTLEEILAIRRAV